MISGNDETQGGDLDALFPGLTRKAAAPLRLEDGAVRAVDLPVPAAADQPRLGRPLVGAASRQRSSGAVAFPVDPRRPFWNPVIAGTALRLWELEPALFPREIGMLAPGLAASAARGGPMGDKAKVAVAELALTGAVALQALWPEERAVAELELTTTATLAGRVEALERLLERTDQPVAWLALQLPAALTVGVASIDRLLQASRPYRELSTPFAALAARQGMRSWEEAVHGALIYWRDPRGSSTLERMVRSLRPAAAGRQAHGREMHPRESAGEGSRPQLRRLEAKLAQAKEEVERVIAGAESWRARVSAAEGEIAELRERRDRAVAQLRRVVAENARLRATLAALPARSEPAVAPARSEPSPATVSPAPSPPIDSVFAGRSVYLYTGVERAGAREAMAKVVERHGARCEVFDGNRLTLLGPERFPAEALVIIETSHLCHNASNVIEARARASGAWYYMGQTGSGALARRVAARWWRTHPVGDPRVLA